MEQATKKSFNSHINLTEELDLLSEIEIPKKYRPILGRIKTGIFARSVTNAEKRLMGQKFKFQLDVFNTPANNSYQNELYKTAKRIAKISGVDEIEERLEVLKMMLLLSFDDFEASVKHLNDDRKEIELKIRKLKQAAPEKPILNEIKKLEEDKNKIIRLIKNAPKRDIYLRRKQLLEERIEKYHREIYKFCLDFIDRVNEDLTPIKEQQSFCELYLNYDLTLTIQKKEKHIIIIDGKKHTANVKVYKFEKLEKCTKVKILKVIKENFKKKFY